MAPRVRYRPPKYAKASSRAFTFRWWQEERQKRHLGGGGGGDISNPVITSAATVNVADEDQLSHSLTSDSTVTWTLDGGADEAQFDITGSTLTWVADGTQDFEAPADANGDNVYLVRVRATEDVSNLFTTQDIAVTVQVGAAVPIALKADFSTPATSQPWAMW
jgi:hypothetical protein